MGKRYKVDFIVGTAMNYPFGWISGVDEEEYSRTTGEWYRFYRGKTLARAMNLARN